MAASFRKGLRGVGVCIALLASWATGAAAATTSVALAEASPAVAPFWDLSRSVQPEASGVAPFIIAAEALGRDRAVECLTSAVYYEAATEPREGQEAVAQVVLNRVRHPAFPKSVCGVVYEGVGGGRACQFTFACDGSTARRPVARRWNAAQAVAENALSGHVAAGIGASTHYHTWWVHPYWPSLVETTRIGAHVFYHLAGDRGSVGALNGHYNGDESATARAAVSRLPTSNRIAVAPPAKAVADFSAWGLPIATVSAKQGHIVVNTAS